MINPSIKRVLSPFVSPPVFDFWAARLNPLWSWDRPLARVIASDLDSDGHRYLLLRANGHCRRPSDGQWLPLTLERSGRRHTCYLRAGAPRPDGLLGLRAEDADPAIQPGDLVEPGIPADRRPTVADEGTASFHVTLLRSGLTLTVPARLPLLQGLEEAGVAPPHGCRRGLCNSCACVRVRGYSRNDLTGETDGEPGAAVRLCTSRPRSDLLLDL